jgi:opacity protein-like surface antigen
MSRSLSRTLALSFALALVSVLALAGAAAAQQGTTSPGAGTNESFGLRGFGARVGLVDPEAASSTVTYGLHLNLGEIVPSLRITPLLEYWSVGVDERDESDLTLALNLDYAFPLVGPKVTPYAGGGLGYHHLESKRLDDESSNNRVGFHVQGGIRDQVMPNLSLFGEARFTFVEDADNWKLLGGFTYNFIY